MPAPKATIAIILGISECPRSPNLERLEQCKNSADDLERYLLDRLGLPSRNIINLFDSDASPSDQIDRIEDWLTKHTEPNNAEKASDLIVYYTGHGGFTRNDQAYFLAVRTTREGSEGSSSIRFIDLASSLKRHAGLLRKYLILDCCFSAAAVFRMMSDPAQLLVKRVVDELPSSGTAFLCSSAAQMASMVLPGSRHTMFSGALLQCLNDGVADGAKLLTLEDLGRATREIIHSKFSDRSVRPELHVPEQGRGNPARVPLFPNPNWKEAEPTPQEARQDVLRNPAISRRPSIKKLRLLRELEEGPPGPRITYLEEPARGNRRTVAIGFALLCFAYSYYTLISRRSPVNDVWLPLFDITELRFEKYPASLVSRFQIEYKEGQATCGVSLTGEHRFEVRGDPSSITVRNEPSAIVITFSGFDPTKVENPRLMFNCSEGNKRGSVAVRADLS